MLFDKTEIFVVVDRGFIYTDRLIHFIVNAWTMTKSKKNTPFLELLGMRSVSFALIFSRMESINIGGIFYFY